MKDRLYVFGGNGANQNNFSGALNDLWQFSLVDDTWTELTPTNDPPPARVGHNAVFIPQTGQLVVFGGNGSDGALLNDVWVLESFTSAVSEIVEDQSIQFELKSANPIEANLEFSPSLEESKMVRIGLIDINGKEVQQLVNQPLGQGDHTFSKSLHELSKGIYFLTLGTGEKTEVVWKLVKQ